MPHVCFANSRESPVDCGICLSRFVPRVAHPSPHPVLEHAAAILSDHLHRSSHTLIRKQERGSGGWDDWWPNCCALREDLVDGVSHSETGLLPFIDLRIRPWNTCWERPVKGAACCPMDDTLSVPVNGHLQSSGLHLSLPVVVRRVPHPHDRPTIFSVTGCAINQPFSQLWFVRCSRRNAPLAPAAVWHIP